MRSTNLKWKLAQKLEYIWWQNYLKKKNPDEYLQWKLGYWHKLLHEISRYISVPEGKTILDAGCGPAGVFLALSGNTVHAIDPLLDKYHDLPHFRVENAGWTRFRTATIESLDAVEEYDVIFCINAINHVNHVEICYDNLVRALKPDGIIVISTDAHKHHVLKRLFQWIPGDALHPVQLDISEYNTFLTSRNMDIVHNLLYEKGNIFDYYITIAKKMIGSGYVAKTGDVKNLDAALDTYNA